MPFSKGRIHRLLRAEGLDPSQKHWASFGRVLARHDTAAEVREDMLRQLRAMDRPSHSAQQIDEWLAQAPPIPVPIAGLLGAHELITQVIGRTVQRCVERDLGTTLSPPDRRAWALDLARAAPSADLRIAQQQFVDHRDPDAIIHFHRVWPEGADLAPVRRAYLDRAQQLDPGFDRTRSVVGYIEVTAHGDPDEKRQLVDWEQSDNRRLVLACGIEMETERGAGTEPSCFSVSDLGDRDHDTAADQLGEDIDRVGVQPREMLELWDLDERAQRVGLGFPAVDRLLRILARAALGRRDAAEVLPELPLPGPGLDAALPDPAATARIAREVWPIVVPWADDLERLRASLALVFAIDSPFTRPAQDALRASSDPATWIRALHALALWRWMTGFAALCDEVERHGNPDFHEIAGDWLADAGPWGFRPRDRARKPRGASGDDDRTYNVFQLDPAGSPSDSALVRLAWPYRRAWWTGTWLVNQWAAASDLVTELLRASGLAEGRRDTLVWAHCIGYSDTPERSWRGFKVRVAETGRVAWSLDELAEWAVRTRPSQQGLRAWRVQNAGRADRLPDEPWTSKACWPEGERDLSWLGDALWPNREIPSRRSAP